MRTLFVRFPAQSAPPAQYAIEGYFSLCQLLFVLFLGQFGVFLGNRAPLATARIVNGLPALERPSMTFLMALM